MWRLKSATIRDVHDELVKQRNVAQTSVASMMQLMHKKGMLKIVDDRRPQKYAAAVDSGATKDAVLKHLAKQLFGGSAKSLIMHVFHSKKSSPEKRAHVEKLLDDLE